MATWTDEQMEAGLPAAEVPADREVMISIRGLRRSFGSREILRGIDLDVYRGETLAILGLSGSGKTTLLKHLMGSLQVEEGTISINGQQLRGLEPQQWAELRRDLGVVFQHAALLGSLTVLQNVGLPLIEVDRLPLDEVRTRVIAALRRVFLPAEEILALKPSDLSGGMRKRVGIARAIIREPLLLLYDEPTTGLDPVTVSGVNELTLELQRRLSVTSVVITHDLNAAFTVADRIAMLYKGRIIALGDGESIKASEHPILQQLLAGKVRGPLTEGYTDGAADPAPSEEDAP